MYHFLFKSWETTILERLVIGIQINVSDGHKILKSPRKENKKEKINTNWLNRMVRQWDVQSRRSVVCVCE